MGALRLGSSRRNGMVLPFVGLLAVALGLLSIYISRTMKVNSGQMVYFNSMNRAYQLAESGLAVALGRLAVDTSTGTMLNLPPLEGGDYSIFAERVDEPEPQSFYIRVSATETFTAHQNACYLHTYASVAGIGTYFAALKNELVVSPGVDAGSGRIYAPTLVFLHSPSVTNKTRAQGAEFVYQAVARDQFDTDVTSWLSSTIVPDQICLGDNQIPASGNECQDALGQYVLPKNLRYPIQFPTLGPQEITRYQNLAGGHQSPAGTSLDFSGQFWTQIFPPGYVGGYLTSTDPYTSSAFGLAGHTASNADHVYYSDTGINIGTPFQPTTIFGQVLFVTKGDIVINGDILSADNSLHPFPGAGNPDESRAHQAVFIGRNIIIRSDSADLQVANARRRIEAFFLCPNGELKVQGVISPAFNRQFEFLGSWVLAQTAPEPNNLPSHFTGNRRYEYMTSLRTAPPPYLPFLARIHNSFEQPVNRTNLY